MQTRSLWTTHEAALGPILTEDIEVDVVVIGAGITGLTAALRLSEMGRKVVVLEARTLCSGVTAGTSAHLTQAVDARYHKIEKQFGKEGSRMVAQASRAALDHIASRTRDLSIGCDLARVPGYLYTEDRGQRDLLATEHAAAQRAGLDVTLDPPLPLPFATAGAIRFADQLKFHPRDYCFGLARELQRRGVRIYENTRIVDVSDGDPVVCKTDRDVTIRARAAFCATHVPLNKLFLHTKLKHTQSYVLAFASDEPLEDALYWDTADPYNYTRVAIVDGVRYLVIGGADHRTGDEDRTRLCFDKMIEYARERYSVSQPAFQWSDQVVESIDGLPLLGRNAASKHVYVATGFGGNGLTFGTAGALLVADLIHGVDNPWRELFDATRIKPSALGEMLAESTALPKNLIGVRHEQPDVSHVSEIPRDDGRTLSVHGKRLAVYRDAQGELHALHARCSHMGCVVRFNQAERSWDCPCHGARFDVEGRVLSGPAVKGLEKHTLPD